MSNWDTLLATYREAVDEYRRDRREPPVACPYDGELLQVRRGKRHCPFDGWTWPDDPNPLFDEV